MNVTVHRVLTGPAAAIGGFRVNINNRAMILLAQGLTIDAESELLGELMGPEDTMAVAVYLPQQRAATDVPLAAG